MFNNNIVCVLKDIRVSNNISQAALGKMTNTSRSLIAMIESGERIPSDEFIISLSRIYKIDMSELIKNINNYKSLDHYFLTDKLIKAIDKRNDYEIKALLEDPIVSEFDYGEPLIIKQYCQILIMIGISNDFNLAYQKCTEFLNINTQNIKNFQPKIGMSNKYYSQITNLMYILNTLELHDKQLILCDLFVSFLEDTFFYTEIPLINIDFFFKKLYIISLNNLADTYFTLGEFNKSLDICNKSIAESNKLNVLNTLPMIIKLQIEIFCSLEKFCSAKESIVRFKSLCEVTNNMPYFENSITLFKSKYAKLFE